MRKLCLVCTGFRPNPIDFTSYTIPSAMVGRFIISDTAYKPNKLFQIWNSAAGSTTSLNKYYRMVGGLNIVPEDEVNRPAVCNSDTNYLMLLNTDFANAVSGVHSYKNPAYGISIHYDACAPVRTRNIAGTSYSYNETYPDWTDNSGGAFGFLTKAGVNYTFPDNNRRRVFSTSIPSGTIVLQHPYPNDEMIGTYDDKTGEESHILFYGQSLYLSCNLRLLNAGTSSPDDTVLILRIPYSTKPGRGNITTPTRYIMFDSVPHPTASLVMIQGQMPPTNRGWSRPMQAGASNQMVITRRMLGSPNTDITFSAHFRLMGDEDPTPNGITGTENHRLWDIYAKDVYKDTIGGIIYERMNNSVNDSGRIKRMEPEVIYKGHCSLAWDWLRIESPVHKRLMSGGIDSILYKSVQNTINKIAVDPSATPWGTYTGSYRWHRLWMIEEDSPRSYHALGYLNHIFGGRSMSETGYTTGWVFREFDENGFGIMGIDTANNYRAVQMQYYTEHYARETNMRDNWRGDTYSLVTHNAAPYVWKSGADTATTLGYFRGYFNGTSEHYNYAGVSYAEMTDDINYLYNPRWHYSSLITIEGTISKYVTDPFMLFDKKRTWLNSIWAAPKVVLLQYNDTICQTCTPGITCPRTAKIDGVRQPTGEEFRFTQWLHKVLGMKGEATWVFRSKALGAGWGDSVALPIPPLTTPDDALFDGFIGLHTMSAIRDTPAPSPSTLSWVKNESLGSDYLQTIDPTHLNLFAATASVLSSNLGVPTDKIYLGRKTMRYMLKNHNDWAYAVQDTLLSFDLDFWRAKGFRTFNTTRTNAKADFFHRKIDSSTIKTRRILYYDTLCKTFVYSEAEPFDSSFYDITMLHDRNNTDTNIIYIGVLNRRTDPIFTIPITDSLDLGTHYANTAISTDKRFCFLPTVEFDSLLTLNHPLVQNKTIHKYCQNGARRMEIPIQLNCTDDATEHRFMRIRDIGGTLDTIMKCSGTLAINLLPGEGRIFSVKLEELRFKDSIRKGYLAHNNQRKIVGYPIYKQDSMGTWIETDSMYYHAVYHRHDSSLLEMPNSSIIFYARSKPMARGLNNRSIEWDSVYSFFGNKIHEIPISYVKFPLAENNVPVPNRYCAYPSIVARRDSLGIPKLYIVYACHKNDIEYMEDMWICESVLPAQGTQPDQILDLVNSGLMETYGNPSDAIPTQLYNWGTPMVNASANGNFYCWSDSLQGIGYGWKHPNSRYFNTLMPHYNYCAWGSTSNQATFGYLNYSRCKFPSLNSYSRIDLGEDNCSLVWQEQKKTDDSPPTYSNPIIHYTRLRLNEWNVIENYITPQTRWSYQVGATMLFHPDYPITALSGYSCKAYKFPVIYREIHGGITCCNRNADTMRTMLWEHIYYELDQADCGEGDKYPIAEHILGHSMIDLYDRPDGMGRMQPDSAHVPFPSYIWSKYNGLYQPDATQGTVEYRNDTTPLPLAPPVWLNNVKRHHHINISDYAVNLNFIEMDTSALPNATATIWQLPHNRFTSTGLSLHELVYADQTYGRRLNTLGEYPHLAARPNITIPDWQRNRRIFEADDNDAPTIFASFERLAKRGMENEAIPIIGFASQDYELLVSPADVNGEKIQWLYKQGERNHPDTIMSEWFRANEETSLSMEIMGGQMEGQTLLENRETKRLHTFPINISTRGKAEKRKYRLLQGEHNEYRLVFINGNRNTQSLRSHTMIRPEEEPTLHKMTENETIINLNPRRYEDMLFALYPNPAKDKLHITWTGGKAELQLINNTGAILTEQSITGDYTLNTEELSNGLYMIRIEQGTHSITKSFIILK